MTIRLTDRASAFLTGSPLSPDKSGFISLFGGTISPTGWQICDGSAISRTTFAELFGVIGTAFGVGDGSTTFNVPILSISIDGVIRNYHIKLYSDQVDMSVSLGSLTVGGYGLFGAGTVTVPSFGFIDDNDGTGTGIYRVAANSLGFTANGVNVGQYSSTGAWTLGTSGSFTTLAHTMNGGLTINGNGNTLILNKQSTPAAMQFQSAGSSIGNIGGRSGGGLDFAGVAGTTFGTFDNSGTWTLGPAATTGSLTHVIRSGDDLTVDFSTNNTAANSDVTLNIKAAATSSPTLSFWKSTEKFKFYIDNNADEFRFDQAASIVGRILAGAWTLGPIVASSTVTHVMHGRAGTIGANAALRLRSDNAPVQGISLDFGFDTSKATTAKEAWIIASENTVGGAGLRFGSNTTDVGGYNTAGVWTLGQAGTSTKNLIVSGAVTFNHNSPDSSPYALEIFGNAAIARSRVVIGGNTTATGMHIIGTGSSSDDTTRTLSIGDVNTDCIIAYGNGQTGFADGSAATPSISFSGDLDTGIYRVTTNSLGFSTAGTSVGTVSSAGSWTIGITTPSGTAVNRHTISSPARTYTRFQGTGTDSDSVIEVFTTGSAGGGIDFFGGTGTGTSSGSARWLYRFNGSNGGATANDLTWYSYGTGNQVGSIAYSNGSWTLGSASTNRHTFNGSIRVLAGTDTFTSGDNFRFSSNTLVVYGGTGGILFGDSANATAGLGSMSNTGVWSLGPSSGYTGNQNIYAGIINVGSNGVGDETFSIRTHNDKKRMFIKGDTTANPAQIALLGKDFGGVGAGGQVVAYSGDTVSASGTNKAHYWYAFPTNGGAVTEVGSVTGQGAWILGPSSGNVNHFVKSGGTNQLDIDQNGAKVRGRQTGTAAASQYIGEMVGTLISVTGGSTYSATTSTALGTGNAQLVSLSVPAGMWLIMARCTSNSNAAGVQFAAFMRVGVNQVSNVAYAAVANTNQGTISFAVPLLLTSTQTVDIYGSINIGSSTVANHEMYAVRIG